MKEIQQEITPITNEDLFIILNHPNAHFDYPIHCHPEYEINLVMNTRGSRIVKFDNEFYITYAYRAHAPGQYWTFAHDVVRLPRCGAYAPAAMAQNLGNTGLAVTTDFRNFHRLGRLTSPVLDDRDVILFPEKIGGKFAMMHRPKQFVGEHYGVKYPSIWLKFSDDLLAWEDKPSHLLIAGREGTWEEKIGGSTPPHTR